MVKKIKKTKLKIINQRQSKNDNDSKAIDILKRQILGKSDDKKNEKTTLTIKKKRQKKKKLNKIQKVKDIKEKKNNTQINEINNGGELSLKKNMSKSKLSLEYKKKGNNQTLLQIIRNKQNLTEVQLTDGINNIKIEKNIHKKKETPKIDVDNKISTRNEEKDDKNEYMKRLKSKISIVDGKMTLEKTDIGLVNKAYKEEHSKNNSSKEAIFISNEKNVNSLSFLKIEHTKKWSEEETNLFYKALELFGLDFSFLEIVLKPRKRIEIKRKYLKEKKENPKEIEKAIYARKNVEKLNKVLNLYKTQNNQNNLGLIREESFKKSNENLKDEKNDFNKEYKDILNK